MRARRWGIWAAAGATAIIALVWTGSAVDGDSAAGRYLDERIEAVASMNAVATTTIDAPITITTSPWAATDVDAAEGEPFDWGEAPTPCDALPDSSSLAQLPDLGPRGLDLTSAAYAQAAAMHDRDVAAAEAATALVAEIESVQDLDAAACETMLELTRLQRLSIQQVGDDLPYGVHPLVARAPEDAPATASVAVGTSLVTPICGGVVGCGNAELADTPAYVQGAWEPWADLAQGYADAFGSCPFDTLAELCDAEAALQQQRAEDEQAIADAYGAADAEAVSAAFAARDAHWNEGTDAVEQLLDDLGASSFETAFLGAWAAELDGAVAIAEAAEVTW